MRLAGITLETSFFEDYLSFLTEVLEWELTELSEKFMRLDLDGTWLAIQGQSPQLEKRNALDVEFSLDAFEFEDLKQRLSFFYYRRDSSRFLFIRSDNELCELVDPDGRIWRFHSLDFSGKTMEKPTGLVRNF